MKGILEGGPVDRTGQIDLGDIVVEAGGAPIQSVDDLHYQVAQPWTKITLLVKCEKECNFLLRKKDRVIEEIQGKLEKAVEDSDKLEKELAKLKIELKDQNIQIEKWKKESKFLGCKE